MPENRQAREERSRRHTEAELKAVVSQLTATLDSTNDGIAVVGFDNRLVRYNQRFSDLWRIPREQLDTGDDADFIATAMSQLIEPESFWGPLQSLKNNPHGETFDQLRFKDGRV